MRWLGPALVCAVLAPADAQAATLANQNGRLTYTGQPGEDNTIEIAEVYGSIQVGPMRGGAATGCRPLNEQIYGCQGVHTIVADLGDGDDLVFTGGNHQAHLFGGAGDDGLTLVTPAYGSTVSGGPGIDTSSIGSRSAEPLTITLDGQANDGVAGSGVNVADDVENVVAHSSLWEGYTLVRYGTVTLTGNAGPNVLTSGGGDDTLTGGAGSDVLVGKGGDDTLDARDGEIDRVECGNGADTALVDQHDHVSDSCETVLAAVIVGPSVADLPPSLAFKPGAALEVDATDDRGVRDVRFLTGDKELCVATRAPYACAFTPRVEDVGRRTIVAIATDSAGQTTTVMRTITVPRLRPRSVSLTVKRKGRRWTATGKVALPSGTPCSGEVAVKVGRKTRTGTLSRACTYRIVLPAGGRFVATYRGTAAIEAKRSAARIVR